MPVQLGLQLYSVRQSLKADPWGTLRRLAESGFTALEAANHSARTDPGVGFGVGAVELRDALADLGMRIIGCHVNPLDLDILPRALDYQAELPISDLVAAATDLPNLEYLLLEQDHTTLDEIDSVQTSRQLISALPGIAA